jgi:hypothetical protein
MQEKGSRLGRTLGYRTGKFLSLATGGTVSAVALLMVLSPFAVGATYHAPYTGVVTKGGYSSWSGCQTNKGSLTFSLKTGIATGSGASTAKTCLKSLGQVGKSSSAYNEPSFQAAINFKAPSGFHHVSANWAINAVLKGSELSSGVCPTPAKFNYMYTGHYGSYYYWDNYTGANQYCAAFAQVYGYIYSYISDLTTGQNANYTSVSIGDSYIQTYNSTYWECYNDTTWNGTAYTHYKGCYGYNTTTQTSAYIGGVYYPSWSGPTSFNNTTSMAKSMFFNNTYFGTHHYILYVNLYMSSSDTADGWSHAVASSSFNLLGPANGVKLASIVVT